MLRQSLAGVTACALPKLNPHIRKPDMTEQIKINLGCGNKAKAGYLGIDKFPCEAVDTIVDIEGTLPFENSSVDEIWMDNVIEHIRDIPKLMTELHRIGKNGALITIITPHFSSAGSWKDPTHIHHLSYFSMDHFEKKDVAHYTGGGFQVFKRELSFSGGGPCKWLGRLLFKRDPLNYERKWCFIFRAGTVRYFMRVIKTQQP